MLCSLKEVVVQTSFSYLDLRLCTLIKQCRCLKNLDDCTECTLCLGSGVYDFAVLKTNRRSIYPSKYFNILIFPYREMGISMSILIFPVDIWIYAHNIFELIRFCKAKSDSIDCWPIRLGRGNQSNRFLPCENGWVQKYSGHIRPSIDRDNQISCIWIWDFEMDISIHFLGWPTNEIFGLKY